jgi:hypothetical protein
MPSAVTLLTCKCQAVFAIHASCRARIISCCAWMTVVLTNIAVGLCRVSPTGFYNPRDFPSTAFRIARMGRGCPQAPLGMQGRAGISGSGFQGQHCGPDGQSRCSCDQNPCGGAHDLEGRIVQFPYVVACVRTSSVWAHASVMALHYLHGKYARTW